MASATPITELPNELTINLDVAGALGIMRLFRTTDAQIFSGYKAHDSLYDKIPAMQKTADMAARMIEGSARHAFMGLAAHTATLASARTCAVAPPQCWHTCRSPDAVLTQPLGQRSTSESLRRCTRWSVAAGLSRVRVAARPTSASRFHVQIHHPV